MDEAKPFCIAKREVWEAYKQVKANRGAAGVDGQSIEDFDKDLSKNLYRIWNRMSSGSYFPPPVRRVDIPKGDTGGTRPLGIPTVSDRIAQMVVKRHLEPILEPVFHRDSYGYRPGRSAHDALVKARQRCWASDWVLDLDIKSFFDEIDWGLLMKAVRRHTDCPWVLLYLERWLRAPVRMPDGDLVERERGTPQGAVVSPVLANLFLHYAFDCWMQREYPDILFERYADDAICHCASEAQARELYRALDKRFAECRLQLHPQRPRSSIAKMQIVRRNTPSGRSTFSAIHSGREWRLAAIGNASSASSRRSAIRPPRGCGSRCEDGGCICVGISIWKRSPNGLVPPLRDGCDTMGGFTPRSFARSSARSMPSSCDGFLGNTKGSEGARWRHGNGYVRFGGATRPCSLTGPWDRRLDDGSRMNREVHVRFWESAGLEPVRIPV